MNYAGFDIANHLNEWAGGTDTSFPKYELLPSAAQKRAFVEAYVDRAYELEGREGEKASAAWSSEVELLLQDVEVFMLVNHFYWGFWGYCQGATEGCAEFDYINYGKERLDQARKIQDAVLG
ncbi:hypothetical protein TeGR_g6379 [Tetraparma gracilis]|uniref:ethanolamine kinase n=1 Tax=Tetraparma gracilis TaxID=2962635 RepID=A0ABQ6MHB2_9STRA|nr:hypothetical protein TeGR_g6379 [Tetraparma gracilis]